MKQCGETKWIILQERSSNLNFLFFWERARGAGEVGWICVGSSSKIPEKKCFFKLILCQIVFCNCSTDIMYLRQKLIRTYFHMWLCILPPRGQTWFLFLLFISPTLLLQCFYIMKLNLNFEGTIVLKGLHFCLDVFLLLVALYCPLLSEKNTHLPLF